jgi:protein TonB
MASADHDAAASRPSPEVRLRSVPALSSDSRRFMIGFTCAALLHGLLIGAAFRSPPRIMGEKGGSPEGISVEVIDEADYRSRTTVPPREQPAPTPSTPSAQPVIPAPTPQAAQPAPAPAPAPAQKKAATTPTLDDSSLPGLLSTPQTLEQPSEKASRQPDASEKHEAPATATTPPSKPRPKAKPDLETPSKSELTFVPVSAGVARPAGITRSGENDDFGRGVIRALRQTMPPHRGIYGRVSIRLVLNDMGNIADVQIVRHSGDPYLDQNVLFASKQSNFPLPPKGSTAVDRTFLVTYAYN